MHSFFKKLRPWANGWTPIHRWVLSPTCISCHKNVQDSPFHCLCMKCFSLIYSVLPPVKLQTNILVYSCGLYQQTLRKLLILGKLKNDLLAQNVLHLLLEKSLEHFSFQKHDYLIGIPTYRIRSFYRGLDFNKPYLDVISKKTKIPILKEGLIKTRYIGRQATLKSPQKRKENVRGVFQASPRVKNRSILLFDDVYTTGATIGSAIDTLQKQGASKITVLTLLRRPS